MHAYERIDMLVYVIASYYMSAVRVIVFDNLEVPGEGP